MEYALERAITNLKNKIRLYAYLMTRCQTSTNPNKYKFATPI